MTTNPRHPFTPASLVLALSVASALACHRGVELQSPSGDSWLVVSGIVTNETGSPQRDAYVRSVASNETQCDAHAHAGVASPEVVRTGASGAFAQLVLASAVARCVHVSVYAADSTRSTSATVETVRFHDRNTPPDTLRLNIVFR